MKALILCAGYATRMYPLTLDKPKHLLPIAGRPMLEYAMEQLNKIGSINKVYIVTNAKFYAMFTSWAESVKSWFSKEIEIFNDGTTSDETKLGAVGDMKFVLDKVGMIDDFLVFAGDNLFELDLSKFIHYAKVKNNITVAVHDVKNLELMKKYSEVTLDSTNKLINFIEKPQCPKTTLAAVCIYFFPKEKLYLIDRYLAEKNNPDQPGRYIEWVHKVVPVYAYVFTEKWYDIGDINQYNEADREYTAKLNKK
jgi:glucose-1-phosphate thymidylyltransferase